MLFLCGCLFVIPPAVSIRCYYKACHGTFCLGETGEVDCEGADEDRCGTLTFATGTIQNVLRNCTRSTVDCNQESTCAKAGEVMAGWGFSSISDCVMTCCEGDVCNAPEEEKEDDNQVVKGPKPPVAIYDEKKVIKTYRIVSGEGQYITFSRLCFFW